MVRLILVRHGETAWNAHQRYQGVTDVALSAKGQRQAQALAPRLSGETIDAIYSSDLQRAWQTAATIAGACRLPVHAEPRLREANFGLWEGLTYDEIKRDYPEALTSWEADPFMVSPPGGESLSALGGRVNNLLEEIRRRCQENTLLLVAHGGSLQVFLCAALGLVPRTQWQFRLSSGSISELYVYEEGAVLTLLNDQHHLLPAGGEPG